MPAHLNARRLAIVAVVLAALPYVPTLDNYFVQDDFGVVGLLASKPAFYFPRWFVVPWMENIWGYTPDELRPFVALTYQVAAQWNAGSPIPAASRQRRAACRQRAARAGDRRARRRIDPAVCRDSRHGVRRSADADRIGGLGHRPRRFDAAFFYLASFYLHCRWRAEGRTPLYWWSIAACFAALFSKQNTITLAQRSWPTT